MSTDSLSIGESGGSTEGCAMLSQQLNGETRAARRALCHRPSEEARPLLSLGRTEELHRSTEPVSSGQGGDASEVS